MSDCARCDDRGWTLNDGQIEPCRCGIYDPPKWVQRGDAPCLLDHYNDPDRPRRASNGWLCAGHYSRLEQMIAELPALYDELGLMLTSSEKPNNEGGKAKHSQVQGGVSLNEKIVEERQTVQLECWRMAHEVRDGCGTDLPTIDTINAICAWLLQSVAWYSEQNDADVTYRILERMTRSAKALANPSHRQKIDLTKQTGRTCATITTCDVMGIQGIPCRGTLTAILTGSGWEGDEGKLVCDRCGSEKPITLVAISDVEKVA